MERSQLQNRCDYDPMHISSPLPLPGVPGDLDVGLLGLVDFRFTFVSAI